MSLLTDLNKDMKDAMKAKEKEKLATIRMLKSAVQNEELLKKEDLTEEEEVSILSREKKQRVDSLQEFQDAGRDDLVEKTEKEIEIVNQYLPKQLSEEEVEGIVQEVIGQTNSSSMEDMGKVMGSVMPKVKGKADGKLVNEIVRSQLSN